MATNVEKKSELMTKGNLWKAFLLISFPVAISNVIVEIFNLLDMYFSKTIGDIEMASTVFVGPITNVIYAFSTGFGVAATVLIAREIANKDYLKGRKYLSHMLTFGVGISFIVCLVCILLSKQILTLAGASKELLEISSIYFNVILISVPFKFFNDIYIGEQRAIGNNKHIMLINISSIIVKVFFSYIFVILLNFGIKGLGYSCLIATAYVSIFALINVFIRRSELKININDFKVEFSLIWEFLLIAIPIVVEKSTQSFGNVIINGYATGLGNDVLSAYGLTNRINSIIFSFSTGFGIALVGIVSQNLALKNYTRIKEGIRKGLILSLSFVSILLIIVLSLNKYIALIFAYNNEILYNNIITAMSVYTISALPWTVMQIYFGVFQGYKKTYYTLIVSLCRLWLFRVLLVGLLLKFTSMGAYAIWYGMLISNILSMVVTLIIYFIDKSFHLVEK